MPKSASLSPAAIIHHHHQDSSSRMSDVALRKKKNADAQAAFRARRANYIATLEETVTSLESVVLQLQDSCRESRSESQELRQEITRLRHEFRERDKLWKALWQARKSGQSTEADDLPPLPPAFSHSQPAVVTQLASTHIQQYSMTYRPTDEGSPLCAGYNYQPSIQYTGNEDADAPSHSRAAKYSPYPYTMHGTTRDAPWPQAVAPSSSSGADSGAPGSSHSPNFVESPTLTSSESYAGRFNVDDRKVSMNNLDTAPYVFPTSRSLSPTTSTPGSSSSTSLTSTFQFSFPDNSVGHDRPEFDYRRNSHPHGEVTLHGGTADISLAGPTSDAVRYRLGSRRANSGGDRSLLPSLPPLSGSDHGSQHERGSSDGDSTPYPQSRRPRRENAPSRSPSPGGPPLSGTLAVIKAQAFGALRRTRARAKKSSEGAAKVAMDVLEARGIGMGVSASGKRRRLGSDDVDPQQT